MVKVFEGTKHEYYLDNYLKSNLDDAKKAVKDDWDMVFMVDGYEGTGKSVFAQQVAYYCDQTFDIDSIPFTPSQFKKAVMGAKEYQAIVYDEAYTGLSSRATMTMINRSLVSMLAEIRQKKLFIIIVMPTFFDLDKYPALWRARALFHVYSHGFKRGYFLCFDMDRKKDLYILGKKFYNYSKPRCNFRGRFTNHYTVKKEEYLAKKKVSLIAREKAKEEIAMKKEIDRMLFERIMLLEDPKITTSIRIKVLAMKPSTFFAARKRWEEMRDLDKI